MENDIERVLGQLDETQSANPFWQDRIRARDLGFRCQPLKATSNRHEPRMQAALKASERIGELSAEINSIKDEYPIHVYWTRINGIYDEVVNFLDARSLQYSPPAVRWYLCAKKITELTAQYVMRPARILEIGAGGGELAYFTYEMCPWQQYVVVDLPPMLANLHANLRTKIAGVNFVVNEWPGEPVDGPQIVLLDPGHACVIPQDTMDVGLNFNSFSEMDESIRDGYIALVYRCLRPDSVFYHVNRRQPKMTRVDGSTFDNHPLLYPYRHDDRVIEFDLDYSQQDVRCQIFRSYPRLPVSRVAIVRPSGTGAGRGQ